jgi:hypothetical protein
VCGSSSSSGVSSSSHCSPCSSSDISSICRSGSCKLLLTSSHVQRY